jgi:hypothetical protein
MGGPGSPSEIGDDMTEWRQIPEFSRYEISNDGRVRSYIPWRNLPTPHEVRQGVGTDGYPQVTIASDQHQRKTFAVHRLLMSVFVGTRPDNQEVRHLDGNRFNCVLSNLQYGTKSENQYDRVRHGRHFAAAKTHCSRGHALAGANMFRDSHGMRQCAECRRIHGRRHREVLRAARPAKPPLHQPRDNGTGGMLITRKAAGHFFQRSPSYIRGVCEAVACDVSTQAALYDFDAVARRFSAAA